MKNFNTKVLECNKCGAKIAYSTKKEMPQTYNCLSEVNKCNKNNK